MDGTVSFDWVASTLIMIFSEINSAWSLWKNLKEWFHSRKRPAESVVSRFVRLFEAHGVHRNQIPRFFGHGLTLKDVQEDATFIAKFDEEMMADACIRFAVRREWLDGAEKQVYLRHEFYGNPEGFLKFVNELRVKDPDGDLRGVLIAPDENDWRNNDALLILQEVIDYVGDKPIYRYYLCESLPLGYWKARGYMAAYVAIAWKHHVYIQGIKQGKKEIARLMQGETLLGWEGEGIWGISGERWHPEDMTYQPEAYLDRIDPEQDNFGITAGLNFWLTLEEQGFMDSGFDKDARLLFEQELAKY